MFYIRQLNFQENSPIYLYFKKKIINLFQLFIDLKDSTRFSISYYYNGRLLKINAISKSLRKYPNQTLTH